MRLPVRDVTERHRALGDRVGERAPRVDQLVEVQVQGAEQGTDHRPVQLLADQRQVDELVQRGFEVMADVFALVWLVERRKVGRCC